MFGNSEIEGVDIVGMPISGMPDCYKPGRGDRGFALGSKTYPQGKSGPLFVKQSAANPKTGSTEIVWKHISGAAASLERIANGEPLTGIGPKIGVAPK